VNRAYGATLRTLAREGVGAFYRGPIAADIVRAVRSHPKPGDLSEQDLATYGALEREPVCGPYRQWRLCSMGPPSAGGVAVLQILGLLERAGFERAAPTPPPRCISSPRPGGSPTPTVLATSAIRICVGSDSKTSGWKVP